MSLTQQCCPECNSENFKRHGRYTVKNGEVRTLFVCQDCSNYFSETKNTPLEGLKTPVSRISLVLDAINDGMGLNAACRTFQVGKNSIKRWINRLGGLKETLLLYARLFADFFDRLVSLPPSGYERRHRCLSGCGL